MPESLEPVTVNFRHDQVVELRALAAEENRSLSQQIRHLVGVGLAVEYEQPEDEAA
jgi:hypothetical protein